MEEGNQELMVAKTTMNEDEKEAYLNSLPAGFRFKPRDDELVGFYLTRKVHNKPLPPNRIKDVHLYKYDPETLTANSGNMSSNGVVNEWYFFTPRDRKYPHGNRPRRGAGDGFWKATGSDKPVKSDGKLIGLKKTLVFYKGKPPNGEKTNWIMYEYILSNPPQRTDKNDKQLDKWVLCRVYKKQKEFKHETPEKITDNQEGITAPQIQSQIQEYGIPPHQYETQIQEYGIPPHQMQAQIQEYGIPPHQTETQIQDYLVPPSAPLHAFPMPSYNIAYHHNSTLDRSPQFPGSYDYMPRHDSTIFPQQPVSVFGHFRPTVAPVSYLPPQNPNQFHLMSANNFNINHHQQQQHWHFLGGGPNFNFTEAEKFLLNADFGLPKI